MKAKTKRRIRHLVTKKKLVKKRTSRHVLRTAIIALATISSGSLAYAITLNKPVVTVAVHTGTGQVISAPATPTPALSSVVQTGRGSWYALGLPAPDSLTCASRTFPRGTFLQVTNLNNNLQVVCRVNDYGPEAWTGRVIDLSRGSFRVVSNLGVGTIPVSIRVTSKPAGFVIPLGTNLNATIGYALCHTKHTAQYCDLNRQN